MSEEENLIYTSNANGRRNIAKERANDYVTNIVSINFATNSSILPFAHRSHNLFQRSHLLILYKYIIDNNQSPHPL